MSLFKRDSAQPAQATLNTRRQGLSTTDLTVKPIPQPEPTPMATPDPSIPSESPVLSAPGLDRNRAAVLDRNTRIQGTLHSDGNVLVEGTFEGDMEARETILVEKDASVKGHFLANDVIVSGSFDGEAVCQNKFRVTPSGSVTGQINTQVLVVEEGSTVNCRFSMAARKELTLWLHNPQQMSARPARAW